MRIVLNPGIGRKRCIVALFEQHLGRIEPQSQVQRGAFAFTDTMPTGPTGLTGFSAMLCHTGNDRNPR